MRNSTTTLIDATCVCLSGRYHELQPPTSASTPTAVKVERTPSDSYFYPYLPPGPGQGGPAGGAPTDSSWWTGCF